MQHWHVYQKWNRCLFREMYCAYKEGRLAKDPTSFWYKGEIGFFDNYIIPLAKKLKECGVFGVSSDEVGTTELSWHLCCLLGLLLLLKSQSHTSPFLFATVFDLCKTESGGMARLWSSSCRKLGGGG